MEYDKDKVDEMVLALLYLTSSRDRYDVIRAWKGMDWETMDRLYQKGYISDPKGKALSVVMTEAGLYYNGFYLKEQYGDWDKSPLTEQSPSIISVCSLR